MGGAINIKCGRGSPHATDFMKIFLSAVSGQFKACRDQLASDLRAVGAEVVVQGPAGNRRLLEDGDVREGC
jgi:hypothetical protein